MLTVLDSEEARRIRQSKTGGNLDIQYRTCSSYLDEDPHSVPISMVCSFIMSFCCRWTILSLTRRR
jgi:hypothetical protein